MYVDVGVTIDKKIARLGLIFFIYLQTTITNRDLHVI